MTDSPWPDGDGDGGGRATVNKDRVLKQVDLLNHDKCLVSKFGTSFIRERGHNHPSPFYTIINQSLH